MRYDEILGLGTKELNKKRAELKLSLFEARMKNSLGQLANQMTIREMRRDIARIQMAIGSKSVGSAVPRSSKVEKVTKAPQSKAKKG